MSLTADSALWRSLLTFLFKDSLQERLTERRSDGLIGEQKSPWSSINILVANNSNNATQIITVVQKGGQSEAKWISQLQ